MISGSFAGRPQDLVDFYIKNRLTGSVWDKMGILRKMARSGSRVAEEVSASAPSVEDKEPSDDDESDGQYILAKRRRVAARDAKPKEWTVQCPTRTRWCTPPKTQKIILQSLEDIEGICKARISDFKSVWFLQMMQRKPLGKLTEGIHEDEGEGHYLFQVSSHSADISLMSHQFVVNASHVAIISRNVR